MDALEQAGQTQAYTRRSKEELYHFSMESLELAGQTQASPFDKYRAYTQ